MAVKFEEGGLATVDDGVHVYVGPSGSANNGIVLTDEGTISIDSFITNYDGLTQAIDQVSNRDVSIAINTHDDADHYTMNHLFRHQGAMIIASDVCRERIATKMAMETWVENLKSRNPAMAHEFDKPEDLIPHIGLEDRATLTVAGEQIELIHMGHGHCPGDLIVNLPERGVLFAGDLIYAGVHGRLKTADIDNLILFLDALMDISCETVVPGHGLPVQGVNIEVITTYKDYVVSLRDRVTELIENGVTLDQMEAELHDWTYKDWAGAKKFGISIEHIYKDAIWRERFGYGGSNIMKPRL